jgi:hypothetical protein
MKTKRSNFLTLVTVAIVSSVVTLFLVLGTSSLGARPQQYSGQENHSISLDQAAKYVQNFKNFPRTPSIKGGFFGKNIFDKILSQTGCVGIRYYYGQDDGGASNLVLVGVDGSGNDMTSGVMGELSIPCPPYCPGPNPLNR